MIPLRVPVATVRLRVINTTTNTTPAQDQELKDLAGDSGIQVCSKDAKDVSLISSELNVQTIVLEFCVENANLDLAYLLEVPSAYAALNHGTECSL